MKIPGPDHPISIEPNPERVVVRAEDRALASTERALTLFEADYPPVQYVPRDDVDMARLERTTHSTHCPFKGDAAYFSIVTDGGRVIDNAAWSYETPYDAVAEIAGYLAFYPQLVDEVGETRDYNQPRRLK